MIVYGLSLSPYVKKVLAFAAEKRIGLSLIPTELRSRDPAFLDASPFGKMPALRDGAFTISDSSAIVAYLDARSGPPLIPEAPEEKARTIWFDEFADTILNGCVRKIFFNRVVAPRLLGRSGDEAVALAAEQDELPPLFDYLERVIPPSNFLVGDRLTLADIAVASPLVNLGHAGVRPSGTDHLRLIAYAEAIHARPSFAGIIDEERRTLRPSS
jgi:glutathione S-transferase